MCLEDIVEKMSGYAWYACKMYVKFQGWKVRCLEDIVEKVSGYGNHNKVYVVMIIVGNWNIQNGLPHPNSLTISTEILHIHLSCDDPSNEIQNLILKNKIVHL